MTRRWSYLTWFNVLVIYWCNFGHLSSDWSIQFLAITNEPFVLLTHGWSHLTWFKVLVLHWCNFGHLSSDWSILFLAITHEPFVLMTCGWCHLTWFKALVLHWCNFGRLSSDWSRRGDVPYAGAVCHGLCAGTVPRVPGGRW